MPLKNTRYHHYDPVFISLSHAVPDTISDPAIARSTCTEFHHTAGCIDRHGSHCIGFPRSFHHPGQRNMVFFRDVDEKERKAIQCSAGSLLGLRNMDLKQPGRNAFDTGMGRLHESTILGT